MTAENIAKLLDEQKVRTLHAGQFDYPAIFRERRLGRDAFIEWARDPRFANTLSKWDGADSLFASGPHLTEPVEIDWQSLRHLPHEIDAALIIADSAVNSLHYQGIDRIGDGVTVHGRSPDGLHEVIAVDGQPFAIGVQWHPEYRPDQNRANASLLRGFGDAVRSGRLENQGHGRD